MKYSRLKVLPQVTGCVNTKPDALLKLTTFFWLLQTRNRYEQERILREWTLGQTSYSVLNCLSGAADEGSLSDDLQPYVTWPHMTSFQLVLSFLPWSSSIRGQEKERRIATG